MDEALIDELWNRQQPILEISGSPASDSCMHNFVSYDMNERWCTVCGKYLNNCIGKLHVAEHSLILRNLPFDTSSKEKYFLTVLENFLGEESATSITLSALKILSNTCKQKIQARCVTRKDVQIFKKVYVTGPIESQSTPI